MVVDQSLKGVYKAGGLSLFAAGFIVVPYFLALLITQTSPTLNPQMVLDNPVPAVPLFALAAFGELLLMPGVLGLYYSLKNVKEAHMLVATALWLVAVISFLVSRGQILSILPISGSYQATTSETLRAAYLVSTEHAIELGNVFAEMALMFFSVSSIIIGLVMLKGVFGRGLSYLVIVAGILTFLGTMGVLLPFLTYLTPVGLVLSAVWQMVVGIKLYRLG